MKGIEGCTRDLRRRQVPVHGARSRRALYTSHPLILVLLVLAPPLTALLGAPSGGWAQEWHLAQARAQAEELLSRSQEQAQEMRLLAQDLARELQQVAIRTRARVRMGVELDPDQGPEYDRQGVRVKGLRAGSPAEVAGLRKNDIITHLNGWSLTEPFPDPEREARLNREESLPVQRLTELAADLERGHEVEIRFLREGRQETVTLEVEDPGRPGAVMVLPRDFRMREGIVRIPELRFDTLRGGIFRFDPELRFDTLWGGVFRYGDPPEAWAGLLRPRTLWGLEIREMSPELAPYFSTERGVLVLEVDEERELGLKPGDVILAIGDRDVESVRDVRRILSSYREGEGVAFQVMRHGQRTRVEGRMD